MTHSNIFQHIENQYVAVVGDVMIDRYLRGSVSRISPEAPVPVVLQHDRRDHLGGAANVALNVQALGGIPLLCGLVGRDADGDFFMEKLLPEHSIQTGGMISSAGRRTTVKTRILGNGQQMLRIDHEDTHDLNEPETEQLLARVEKLFREFPVKTLILQDYNKGLLTETVIREIIKRAKQRGIFCAVDPKKRNFFAYEGVDLFKPNLKEIRESAPFAVSTDLESLEKSACFLQEKLKNRFTMLTLSEKGLYLKAGNTSGQCYPTSARTVADVSGAGDTVISIAAMCLSAGIDPAVVAALSNLAGGQVCEYAGVVPVNLDLLKTEWENDRAGKRL